MAEFTPGPWLVDDGEGLPCIYSEEHGPIAQMSCDSDTDVTSEHAEANAFLVAAAPDLLTALEATICHSCDNRIGWDGDRRLCASCPPARAAITRAKRGVPA
jgi:hypothetical protein